MFSYNRSDWVVVGAVWFFLFSESFDWLIIRLKRFGCSALIKLPDSHIHSLLPASVRSHHVPFIILHVDLKHCWKNWATANWESTTPSETSSVMLTHFTRGLRQFICLRATSKKDPNASFLLFKATEIVQLVSKVCFCPVDLNRPSLTAARVCSLPAFCRPQKVTYHSKHKVFIQFGRAGSDTGESVQT